MDPRPWKPSGTPPNRHFRIGKRVCGSREEDQLFHPDPPDGEEDREKDVHKKKNDFSGVSAPPGLRGVGPSGSRETGKVAPNEGLRRSP